MAADSTLKSIVLVHGGFVDGSGWEGVYDILNSDGYDVTIVQNPTVTLEDDVTVTKCAIAAASGGVVLVGHSYGDVVISEAGTDPKVKALVGDVTLVHRSAPRRFPMNSRSCAGHGFPLRHCADPMKVSGESGVLLARRDEKISTAENTDINTCTPPTDRKPCITRCRFRRGRWEFSARLFTPLCDRCSTVGITSRFAAPAAKGAV